MKDKQDGLLVAIFSMAFTALVMTGIFYICYPEFKALHKDKLVCAPMYSDLTT